MRRWLFYGLFMVTLAAVAGCETKPAQPENTWEERGQLVTDIEVPGGQGNTGMLELRFGAADFRLRGENMRPMVEGKVYHRSADLRPEVQTVNGRVRIDQPARWTSLPDAWKTTWDLRLSTRYPLELDINAGAFTGEFDFSGIPLLQLKMKTGAAEGKVYFKRRNPREMQRMVIQTGASSFEMDGLLNARFHKMDFEGGAGSYRLNFTGSLRDSARVSIKVGVCDLKLEIPRHIPARVTINGAMTSISHGSFLLAGTREYVNRSFRENADFLDISINMGLGSISLHELN